MVKYGKLRERKKNPTEMSIVDYYTVLNSIQVLRKAIKYCITTYYYYNLVYSNISCLCSTI